MVLVAIAFILLVCDATQSLIFGAVYCWSKCFANDENWHGYHYITGVQLKVIKSLMMGCDLSLIYLFIS